ncbi:MAG: hypothetical protein HYS12_14270 [Planctomycetes bacterium]|nr:hypothetical protein [Planctomycetota bacterium]
MLTIQEIQQALHARCAVPLPPGNYHGPLGLERLAAVIAQLGEAGGSVAAGDRVRRAIELDVKTWEKLDRLARSTGQTAARRVSASEVAAAIIEQFVAATSEAP